MSGRCHTEASDSALSAPVWHVSRLITECARAPTLAQATALAEPSPARDCRGDVRLCEASARRDRREDGDPVQAQRKLARGAQPDARRAGDGGPDARAARPGARRPAGLPRVAAWL